MDIASVTGGRQHSRKDIVSALPVLIFDFDGTVSLGDGPVAAYAAVVAEGLSGHVACDARSGGVRGQEDPSLVAVRSQDRFTAEIAEGLEGHLEGYIDGYDLVRSVALRYGVSEAELSSAYLASRELLATPECAIAAPAGLAEFLRDARAERILLTNAPAIRIDEALHALGLEGCFDRIITDGGKPAGLTTLLDSIAPERRVLSIGDVWANDLGPAHERGHATAYVGAQAMGGQHPLASYRGSTVAELLPQLTAWLADAAH